MKRPSTTVLAAVGGSGHEQRRQLDAGRGQR